MPLAVSGIGVIFSTAPLTPTVVVGDTALVSCVSGMILLMVVCSNGFVDLLDPKNRLGRIGHIGPADYSKTR
jgi:hypothetical protein